MPEEKGNETEVDGVLSQYEYYGAFILPYDNRVLEADDGRVHVSIEDDGEPGNAEKLRVFMDDIPVSLNANERGPGVCDPPGR
ncbi:MAG: hypothetical protein ACOCUS_01865 [Polyangiales bacterium]